MTLEDWQAVGIVCGSILAVLTLLGVLDRKVIRPMWRTMKLAARLVEQLVGDADEGIPSLMDQMAALRRSDVELARKLDDHLEWHASPGGRPAKPTTTPTNGPMPPPPRRR